MPENFPHPMPFGWFAVARVDEVPDGAVVAIERFGQKLVAWKSGDDLHVAGAVCPHMGAHLGVGGWVADGCLVCPFHEWAFGPDGTNLDIPYADKPNRKARLDVWRSAVANGLLMAWYHPDPTVEPTYEVPQLVPDGVTETGRFDRVVRTQWQEIAENGVDMAHFKSVHGAGRVSTVGEQIFDGPFRQVQSDQEFGSSKGAMPAHLKANTLGPGIGVQLFTMLGSTVISVSSTTAIDERSCLQKFTFYSDGSDIADRIAPSFALEVERQFEQDVPIWENKVYLAVPALAPSEKPVMDFRKWASQFYAEA